MAVKLSMASVAVCSSMFSSWHNVSKLLRTELSSILLDSESEDSSPRIRTSDRYNFNLSSNLKTKTQRPSFPLPNNTAHQLVQDTTTSVISPPQCSALARKLHDPDQSEARGASVLSCSPNPLPQAESSCSADALAPCFQLLPGNHFWSAQPKTCSINLF